MDAKATGATDGRCRLLLGDFELFATRGNTTASGDVKVVIRPERVEVEDRGATGENKVPGMVERVVYVGPVIQLLLRVANGAELQAMIPNRGQDVTYSQGTAVTISLPVDALRVLEDSGERAPRDSARDSDDPGRVAPPPMQTQAS